MNSATQLVLDTLFGRWRSRILYAGTQLGVFDALDATPRSATAIASELAVDGPLLARLLRALASLGFAQQHDQAHFSISAAGHLLASDAEQSLRGFVLLQEGPEHYAIWKHLPAMIRDGEQNGFLREFGQMAFDYARDHAAYGDAFKQAMSSFATVQSEQVVQALQHYDFKAAEHLCDVGGGQGHLLCSLLARHSTLTGSVLDLAEVLGDRQALWAPRMGVQARCEYVAGDMFTQVPGADAYFLKLILHDWNDEECVAILRSLRQAARADARLFIVERVVRGPAVADFAKLYDIHMLCWGTGRERTAEQYGELLQAAGWHLHRQLDVPPGHIDILEARLGAA